MSIRHIIKRDHHYSTECRHKGKVNDCERLILSTSAVYKKVQIAIVLCGLFNCYNQDDLTLVKTPLLARIITLYAGGIPYE